MNGLKERFVGQIEFVILDWDDPTLNDARTRLGITDRTQYALANAAGDVIKRWYGQLNEARVAAELEALLKG